MGVPSNNAGKDLEPESLPQCLATGSNGRSRRLLRWGHTDHQGVGRPPASNSAGGLPACSAPSHPLTSQGAHGGSLRAGRGGDTGFAAAPAPGTVSHGAFSARDLPVVLSCESHSARQGPGHLGGTSGGTDEIQEQSPQPLTPTHPFLSLGTCLFCSLASVESHASGLCVRRLTEHRVSEVRPRRSQRPRPPPPPFRGRATLPFVDGTLCPSCAFGLLRILPLGASEAGFGVDAHFPLPWVDTDTW